MYISINEFKANLPKFYPTLFPTNKKEEPKKEETKQAENSNK